MMAGTPEQREKFVIPTMRGDLQWCQGFSEPSGGSDLAALKTRAVLDGDHYIVNGAKPWTSGADHADWCFLLARSDPPESGPGASRPPTPGLTPPRSGSTTSSSRSRTGSATPGPAGSWPW